MSIFADEWRDCLREQYKSAVRNDDRVTLRTLTQVLVGDIGFTESELAELRVEATLRVEDVPEDFVPDLNILQAEEPEHVMAEASAAGLEEFMPHPLECQCPACVEINLKPHDEEGQPLSEEAIQELQEEVINKPQQLSLF
ncbi:MAG: hypothetical protein OHK0046_32380 [Anaerolineae bacterium]